MAYDTSSYGQNQRPTDQVKAWGVVANIADPLNSGRIKVRMVGYEDNEGTIPDDKLMWYDTDSQGPQIKGVGTSHKYSVGTTVKLENTAGKWTVVGSGTSSGDPKSNSDAIDTKDGGYPKSSRKSSPGIEDLKLDVKGVDLLGDLRKKVNFTSSSLLSYAANESNGGAAKFKDLPNIGAFLFNGAANPIAAIKALDPGNLSGAIKTALDIATNFGMSQLGSLSSMLGAGPLAGALSQVQSLFGPVGLLADAAKAVGAVTGALNTVTNLAQNLNAQTLLNNTAAIQNLPMALSDPTLNIPFEIRSQVEAAVNGITNSLANGDTTTALAKVAALTAATSVVSNQIGPLAAKLASTPIQPLAAAQLALDFSGKLTEIKIPELPKLGIGPSSFPKIPTFKQEQALLAQATSSALSAAMSATGAAGAVAGAVGTAVRTASSIIT
jgi:hypothetical protein